MTQTQQMVFSFPRQTLFRPEEFLPMSFNAAALTATQRLITQGHGMLFVYGPEGCGKSHLLHLAANHLGCLVYTPSSLPQDPTNQRTLVLDMLEEANKATQEVLFHYFNALKARGGVLLVASRCPASQLNFLPDLTSRLKTVEHVALKRPDLAHLELLLVKFASDRQLQLEPAVVRYILRRVERSPRVLEGLMASLDEKSLEKGRPISVPFVKQVLEAEEVLNASH